MHPSNVFPRIRRIRLAYAITACVGLIATLAIAPEAAASPPTTASTPTAAAAGGGGAAFRAVRAVRTTTLLNVEGVNIHSADGTTPYSDYANVTKLLAGLGIEHVRDFLAYNPNFVRHDQYDFFNSLKAAGIGVDIILSQDAGLSDLRARVAAVAKWFPKAVDAVESPNELNLSGDPHWAVDDIAYQKQMYADVRATPSLRNATVLAPSLGLRTGYSDLGNLTPWIDAGNIHLYPGGRVPTFRMDDEIAAEKVVSRAKPEWVTESGYHDAMFTLIDHPPTSDAATAIYLPRLYLEYFTRGVKRVYDFELYNEHPDLTLSHYQADFGMVTYGGRLKPQYYAIRNFNALLHDDVPGFVPGSLTYSLTSDKPGIESKLLERSDGTFVLMLWQDAEVWNYQAKMGLTVPATQVTVQFPRNIHRVTENRPSVSGDVQRALTGVSSITVPVTGDVVALSVRP